MKRYGMTIGLRAEKIDEYKKLHAPKQTVVEGVYRDGKMQSLRVRPESRRADVKIGQ